MIPNYYLLTVFCFLSTLHVCLSLKCFICTSSLGNCNDPFNKTAQTPEICDMATHVCLKNKLSASGKQSASTQRSCIHKDHCNSKPMSSVFCSTCAADFCNSSIKSNANYYLYSIIVATLISCT